MSCLSPVHIPVYKVENVKGKLQKVKHYIEVPCGKCPACLSRAQQQWQFRIEQEVLDPAVVSALFVTLTYAPKYLPIDKCVNKEDVQKYLKRLRKNLERYIPSPRLRYYACGEYGELNFRPHYHLILTFTRSIDWKIIEQSWGKGIVDIAPFTPARAGYVAKYSLKQYGINYKGLRPPFRLCSKGLGKYFLVGRNARSLGYSNRFGNISGRDTVLHRYYIDKLYPHYKRSYSFIDTPFGRLRVSSRENVSTFARSNYLLKAERFYNDYCRKQSFSHYDGYLGFINDSCIGRYNSLGYQSTQLLLKQSLKF